MNEDRLKEIERRFERIHATQEVANVMARYEYYHSGARQKDIANLYALELPDVRMEMGGSVFDGPEGVKYFWLGIMDEAESDMSGRLYKHDLLSPCIEVAADCKTAIAVWHSVGMETGIGDDGHYISNWNWLAYKVDFICIDGVWKIWHSRMYPQVETPFDDRGWSYIPYHNFFQNVEKYTNHHHIVKGSRTKECHPFSLKTVTHDMHLGYPVPPMPYDTYTPEMAEVERELIFNDSEEYFDPGNPAEHPNKYYISDACVCCGKCKSQCPESAIKKGKSHYVIDPALCRACATCVEFCPNNAISLGGE